MGNTAVVSVQNQAVILKQINFIHFISVFTTSKVVSIVLYISKKRIKLAREFKNKSMFDAQNKSKFVSL